MAAPIPVAEAAAASIGDTSGLAPTIAVASEVAVAKAVPELQRAEYSEGAREARNRVRSSLAWWLQRCTFSSETELTSTLDKLCMGRTTAGHPLGGEVRLGGKLLISLFAGKTQEEAVTMLAELHIEEATALSIFRAATEKAPKRASTSAATAVVASAAARPSRDGGEPADLDRLVHVKAAAPVATAALEAATQAAAPATSPAAEASAAAAATRAGRQEPIVEEPAALAARTYGACGFCQGGRLPDAWRAVVDGRPACTECYGTTATQGAREVQIRCDMGARIASSVPPGGYAAAVEGRCVEWLRRWNAMRKELSPEEHMVMGGRIQLQVPNNWPSLKAGGRTNMVGKRVGGTLSEHEEAPGLYQNLADGAFELFREHDREIGAVYDRLFPSRGTGALQFFAIEFVHAEGPEDAQFVHNRRVPEGTMQVVIFLTRASKATMHVWWIPGLADAQGQVRSLRNDVLGNRPEWMSDPDFEAELCKDGDLAAIASATSAAELRNVGRRPMFPGPVAAGHIQGLSHDVNHYGDVVLSGVDRSLLVALVSRGGQRGQEGDLQAEQQHGALKVGNLGLVSTMFNSPTLQRQFRTRYLAKVGPEGYGVLPASKWKMMINPAFGPAGATAQVSGAAAAPASKGRRKRTAARAEPAETPSKRKATAGGGMLGLNPNVIDWVVQHSRNMISVSKSTTLKQLAFRRKHVFKLKPGAELEWDFAGAYHSECGNVTEGALTIQCRDTAERVVIKMGETIRIRRGLRCFLKNEGTRTMKKTYAVFDKDGNELVDFDHDAEAPRGELTCDNCKKDAWYESFQVGNFDYCPTCLSTEATDAQRDAAKRQVFGEEGPCA